MQDPLSPGLLPTGWPAVGKDQIVSVAVDLDPVRREFSRFQRIVVVGVKRRIREKAMVEHYLSLDGEEDR